MEWAKKGREFVPYNTSANSHCWHQSFFFSSCLDLRAPVQIRPSSVPFQSGNLGRDEIGPLAYTEWGSNIALQNFQSVAYSWPLHFLSIWIRVPWWKRARKSLLTAVVIYQIIAPTYGFLMGKTFEGKSLVTSLVWIGKHRLTWCTLAETSFVRSYGEGGLKQRWSPLSSFHHPSPPHDEEVEEVPIRERVWA